MALKRAADCHAANKIVKTALFTNFTDEEFVGYWDGKARKFKPGQSLWMDEYLARHYAKHLSNQELLRKKPDGTPIYKDGEKFTSPKFPEQVPQFMDLFNKAFQLEEDDQEVPAEKDAIDVRIEALNKNKQADKKAEKTQNPNEPQTVLSPDFDEEDESVK